MFKILCVPDGRYIDKFYIEYITRVRKYKTNLTKLFRHNSFILWFNMRLCLPLFSPCLIRFSDFGSGNCYNI